MERSSFQPLRGSQAFFYWRRRYFTGEPDNEFTSGVVFDGLGVTKTDSGVAVAAGTALVHGFPYRSDADVAFAIPVPTTGTTGHRVVLRADWATSEVRAALKSSPDGTATIPTLTKTDGTLWEESLANITVTTAGVFTITPNKTGLTTGFVGTPNDMNAFQRSPYLRQHVGGSATDWAVPGATTYDLIGTSMITGVARWMGAASSTGTAAVNLTDIVTAGFLAFASLQTTHVTVGVRPIGTMLYLDWRTVDGSTRTTLDIHWVTIGPE